MCAGSPETTSALMSQAAVRFIPHGMLLDYIDGTLRQETPEEYVRQEIAKSLVNEYRYKRSEISVEFRVQLGRSSKRADLVIFPAGVQHEQEHAWAIIECKAPKISAKDKQHGVEQLKSYMAGCANSVFGMWTNGQHRICFHKLVEDDGHVRFHDIPDIPEKGKTLDESERPRLAELRPASSDALLFTFKRCHNYIAGNQGLQKPEAFWELLKLIFCKIEDERSSRHIEFYASSRDRRLNGQLRVKSRIEHLFASVRNKYPAIFRPNDSIELEPPVLAYIVAQLQPWSLLDSNVDVKGKAYEEIVGSNLRGDRGEFFTPRNICSMAVKMLDPSPDDLVMDPACGTGGFLTIAMNHVIEKLRVHEKQKWRNSYSPTEREFRELYRKISEYANQCIVGIDINPNLVKASKMNMVMNNDGSGGLYQGNSLAHPVMWNERLRSRRLIDSVDLLFTNPPFGSKITIDDPAILEQYDLAHTWDYEESADRYYMRRPLRLQTKRPPEILFIERCVKFLKPGTGRMAIVLPDGILGAPSLGYVREWILDQTRVLASIDLHPDAFQPGNSTQTSLLILERKRNEEIELERAAGEKQDYNVFMALANHIGHDKRGKRTFVRDAQGNAVIVKRKERVREMHEGIAVFRNIEVAEKLVDDNTGQIAEAYREWFASSR